jgi:hypothetical protein
MAAQNSRGGESRSNVFKVGGGLEQRLVQAASVTD